MKYTKGFTFIELLVSIGILIVVSTIIVSILFTSLRVNKKSETLINLKQNGSTALTQMTRTIRYAKSLDAPAVCTTPVIQKSITITALDGKQTTFSCPVGPQVAITSNSASLIDTTTVAVTACSFTCTQQTTNDAPAITIQFTLNAKSSTTLTETTGSLPFQTSVTLRNFSP